jgi:hypothetical protein
MHQYYKPTATASSGSSGSTSLILSAIIAITTATGADGVYSDNDNDNDYDIISHHGLCTRVLSATTYKLLCIIIIYMYILKVAPLVVN